jgi:hypothetical protein
MSLSFVSRCWMAASCAGLAAVLLTSCARGPAAVHQPYIDASGAGSQAMEMYDTNGDGKVAGEELEKAPSLKAALQNLDKNGDKGVSADEVAERVNAWKAMESGMTSVRCRVTLNGQPLEGAKVVFEPEPFLGDGVKAAHGTTNLYGDVAPSISPEDRPSPDLPGGAHFGLYKVKISKIVDGKETIPPRYNEQTILGQEVSYDDPAIKSMIIKLVLESR